MSTCTRPGTVGNRYKYSCILLCDNYLVLNCCTGTYMINCSIRSNIISGHICRHICRHICHDICHLILLIINTLVQNSITQTIHHMYNHDVDLTILTPAPHYWGGFSCPKKAKNQKIWAKFWKWCHRQVQRKLIWTSNFFSIYLRPPEKHFICFKTSRNPNTNL